ncbi:MAG TPA: tRNA (adenosine(37)-N6)-dimethylallyltransferase MiaA [Sulfurovum sp.]|nr:tRNA (adenosine(37)-N6)-dimethylallyltransferase MiaA [Sulfurovum sp.]
MPYPKNFQQIALIGPTASGKTALSVKVAHKMNAYILSLDSLSIYKDINIVSAKPTVEERQDIQHFGIDYIYPNENFDVTTFIKLYKNIQNKCIQENKNLVIIGGTSFYLKMLIDGISELPTISESTLLEAEIYLKDIQKTYTWLSKIDKAYMSNIASNDRYRIEKALCIYLETKHIPTEYFAVHPPIPSISSLLPIYQISWDRALLRERISQRTKNMLEDGLIDEICMLEKKYGRSPNCMKSIGIVETLQYLDGNYNRKMLIDKITTNTARLAKRQTTFNNSQFNNVTKGSVDALEKILL